MDLCSPPIVLVGAREAFVDRQRVLPDAVAASGVPRFIPPGYAANFTFTRPGDNRNFDLRREFLARIDTAPVRAASLFK